MLRDESMASSAAAWLSENTNGILVGCIGINHATFGCGVPGRLERMLSSSRIATASKSGRKKSNSRQRKLVVSVLINPEPLNTGTELKICQVEGKPPIDDDDDDKVKQFFIPNKSSQVCIENSIELQNYALQLPPTGNLQDRGRVMGLSDYLVFSPK